MKSQQIRRFSGNYSGNISLVCEWDGHGMYKYLWYKEKEKGNVEENWGSGGNGSEKGKTWEE